MSSLAVRYSGVYKIKVWITSSLDNVPYDDTLVYEYVSGRIPLPVDEDFSSGIIPVAQFLNVPIVPDVATNVWAPYTDSTSQIQPPEGNGMIRYVGKRGTMTKLTTRQLDLYGSVDPKLEFWYYYDSTATEMDNSYTEVRVIKDYVPTTELILYRKDGSYGYGWHLHTVELNPYKDGECILVEFGSMNKYDDQSAQYLAHVLITSTPDLEVSEILVSPEVTVCDMTNKEIQVVLKTTANQSIDFSRNPTSLAVEIPGVQIPPYTLQHVMTGNSTDTITVASGVDLTDITDIKSYLTVSVDNYPDNDTTVYRMNIHPKLDLKVVSATEKIYCFKTGIETQQTVILKNSGNVDLSGIKLQLIVSAGDNYTDTITEPGAISLSVDSTLEYIFESPYTVPQEDYMVKVMAWLECDPEKIDTVHAEEECVDLHNLSLISIDNPLSGQKDTVGTAQSISVTVNNMDQRALFDNIDITALVEGEQGQVLQTITEMLPTVNPSAVLPFTFSEKYTVPNDSLYIIRVYINSGDLYTDNDTLFVQLESVPADTNVGITYAGNLSAFSLEQNIPNPANNTTHINYSIPTAGDVVFYVHSINGQVLYTRKISTPQGTHTIELNTATFAAGIYFYSIEYKGQKLVRKLTINK
jgi:hypothetical protein